MRKSKGESACLIRLPINELGAKGLDLLAEDGRVYGVSYQGRAAIVATRRQLRKLDRAGIPWQPVKPASRNRHAQKTVPGRR